MRRIYWITGTLCELYFFSIGFLCKLMSYTHCGSSFRFLGLFHVWSLELHVSRSRVLFNLEDSSRASHANAVCLHDARGPFPAGHFTACKYYFSRIHRRQFDLMFDVLLSFLADTRILHGFYQHLWRIRFQFCACPCLNYLNALLLTVL